MPIDCSHCSSRGEQSLSADAAEHGAACICGDSFPVEPMVPAVPGSSETALKNLSLIACINGCRNEAVVGATATPARSFVLSSESLTHNYRQVVLCVWLT